MTSQLDDAKVADFTDLELQSLTACHSASDFEVAGVVGSGQCGIVLQVRCMAAHHPAPAGRTYSLKVMYNYGHDTLQAATVFRDEYEVLARLPRHRNVLRYLSQFNDRLPAAWLQYLPEAARELAQLRDTRGNLTGRLATMQFILLEFHPRSLAACLKDPRLNSDMPQLLRWSIDVVQGAAHLQAHKVLHRDVKLDNILIAHDGRAVIADFGMAVRLPADTDWSLTLPHGASIGGNPAHLAPEVLSAAKQAADRPAPMLRLDYGGQPSFEIAVTLYELLLGQHPVHAYDYPAVPFVAGSYKYDDEHLSLLPDELGYELQVHAKQMTACTPSRRPVLASILPLLSAALDSLTRKPTMDKALGPCGSCSKYEKQVQSLQELLAASQLAVTTAEDAYHALAKRMEDKCAAHEVKVYQLQQSAQASADRIRQLEAQLKEAMDGKSRAEATRDDAISEARNAKREFNALHERLASATRAPAAAPAAAAAAAPAPAPSSPKVIHRDVRCDGCGMDPIVGSRFKCRACANYDLCGNCKSRNVHSGHPFALIVPDEGIPFPFPFARAHQAVHPGVNCDNCGTKPIVGTRHNCTVCPNYDLCEACRRRGVHSHHVFQPM